MSASRSAIPWEISNRMLETTEVAHAEVFVAEEPNLKSLTPKAQFAVCLTGAWIISPAFFQGMAACQKFARTSQIYRRLHVTSSFHEHHKSLLDVLKVVCACRGSQTKIVMDVDTFLRAYEAAAPARRTSFIILRTKHDGDMVEGFPSGMLQMNFWEFLAKVKN